MRILAPAVLVLAALLALFASLAFGGATDPLLIADPGPFVRFGLPISKLFVNVGVAGALGSLVFVLFALDAARPEFARALDIAAASAAVWTVASAFTAFFTFLTIYQQPITFDSAFGDVLSRFLTTTELGQGWLATTLIAAAVTVLCFAVRNLWMLVAVAALTTVGLLPMTLQGHSGGTADHAAATTALFLHLLFAGVWLGGLLTLTLIRDTLEKGRLEVALRRYSSIALVCFVVVAASGYVSAQIRVDSLPNLLTPYGILVLAKAGALLALGLFGAGQRQFFIGRIASSPTGGRGIFWFVVTAEIAFMGIASGVAAALARTPTPVPQIRGVDLANPSPAEYLTGAPLPPPVSFENVVTLWKFDVLWILACAFGIVFYALGVLRLRRRGDAWPWYRTVLWVSGLLVFFWVTNGGINVYEKYLFSQHMLGHMMLGMLIPVLLVGGAPITLALRAIHKRTDGSRGPREWLMLLVHSRYFAVLANPIVASVLFVVSLWIFYYTPLFSWATTDHLGHLWMIVHFVLTGYLFMSALIGIDPAPSRPAYPIRLVLLLATMAFHAFFGLAIMTGTGLLLSNWYGAMGWGTSAIADQQAGGGIAWSVGEIPNAIIALVIVYLWSRSDARESKRYDRKAERDGDAELAEYNAMLARRAGLAVPSRTEPSPSAPRRASEPARD